MYNVEYGVKGAMRIQNKSFPDQETAAQFAERWARSNSTGHYWAEVTCILSGSKGTLKLQYNLG
jgi:hypothetical protein